MSQIHFRACNLCEAICGLALSVENNRVTAVRGDPDDPFSRGHICPKAVALIDIQDDPDRLRTPQLRTADGWQALDWDAALNLAADQLVGIVQAHGDDAIAVYQGNPSVHQYGLLQYANAVLANFKTRNRFSATSLDQLPTQLVTWWMYGHQLLIPIPDIDHTDFFLIIGANPAASNGSLMTVPDFAERAKALRKRGSKLVLIDPRRTETAAYASDYFGIVPGTDAAFVAALLNCILLEGLARPDRLTAFTDGLDALPALLGEYTADRVSAICGIEATVIRDIARRFANAPRAVAYGRMGACTQRFGTLTQWLIQLLNIVTGNLDRVGGALVTHPALDPLTRGRAGSYGRWHSRVSGRPEVHGELPTAVMAEEMETPGPGQIRALITVAGNPVLSAPNGKRIDAALRGLDFVLSFDSYCNETTAHANLILPTGTALENVHYDLIFNVFAVRNVARFNAPILHSDAPKTHEIFLRLGAKIAARLGKPARALPEPEVLIDSALRAGSSGLDLAQLKAAPHGIDLGPLAASFPERLFTEHQRIQAVPPALQEAWLKAGAELLATSAPTHANTLQLIGRRHVRSNNSWMHNYQRLIKGKDRSQLLMNPVDAAARHLTDGTNVRIRSRVGCVTATLSLSDSMFPGVVSLPHGFGHQRNGVRLALASQLSGPSINDLTDDLYLDELSGNAAFNGVAIWVEAELATRD